MPPKKALQILVLQLSCCTSILTLAQSVRVEHNVPVSQAGDWYPWYAAAIDPENASNRIICGSKWDAKDNASYGFVSFSSDGGETWKETLLDRNSAWVTEQSCAYGIHGLAYFIADASKVINGTPHHELGTTRIYVTHDAGKTWKLGVTTGWTDYSASVVDIAPGPNQNRLYIYFNNLQIFYTSIGKTDAAEAEKKDSNGTRVGMISWKDGDPSTAGPFTSAEMAKESYHGSYPAPAFLLKDGSLVTIYTTKRRTDKNAHEFMVESARTSADRRSLETPVKVVDSLDTSENDPSVPCGGYYLDPAATYDAAHDKLYFAYSDVRNKQCQLFLTTSTDGGRSWSKAQAVYNNYATPDTQYGSPAIAVNDGGLLALMWQDKFRSGCWTFATSDNGKSLSRPTQLGTCAAADIKPSQLSSAYLWDSFFQADSESHNATARINLRNTHNGMWRNLDVLAVTPDGAFHPVWLDAGNGEGELRTAAIRVTPAATLISNATAGLGEVTSKVAVLYGGDQSYEAQSKLLSLDVVIKNNSDQPLTGPFKLAVPRANDGKFAEIANADNHVSGSGAVWDISSSVPGGKLPPGATSKPFTLKFRYLADDDTPRNSDDILGLSVKVFARASVNVVKEAWQSR